MSILVTGGAGYIGSHTCIELLNSGYDVVVFDNFSNSSPESLVRVGKITGKAIPFTCGDIRDPEALEKVFSENKIEAVIHFAGLKAVGESCELPLHYYENNVGGTLNLCREMQAHGVHKILFSSSATVYGDPQSVPIREDFPTGATNPYGRSKLIVEEILQDLCKAPDSAWQVSILRYFNPIGAHASGLIGEDPHGIPNNLLPYVSQVAVGKLKQLRVFGSDYPTADGTGVRDYIHVVDLVLGHVAALKKLDNCASGAYIYNLGTGAGYSVLDIVRAFEKASGKHIPYEIVARRAGDIAECYADPSLAKRELNWQAKFDVEQMVEDAWRWQAQNPAGYSET